MISEVAIFAFGCIVTLFIGGAVGLLLYGAQEEHETS